MGALQTIGIIAIIVVAFFDVVLLALLILIAFFLYRLLRRVPGQIVPIVSNVTTTTRTIEGTADFIATTAVSPLIQAVSLLYAIARFLQVLFGRSRTREG